MNFKAGFVNIIGNPNVGKSTLMNHLVGEHLAIITSKAQTTRHRILGIVTEENYQIVYSDTPGIIQPHYKLQEAMMKEVETALEDADIIILMTEAQDDFDNESVIEKIKNLKIPLIVVINKIDLSTQEVVNLKISLWQNKLPGAEVIPVSALENFNTQLVQQKVIENLPEGEPFYGEDELTDKNERFFVSEIIREKILNLYHREVPYSCEVAIEEFAEDNEKVRIKAYIFVSRESQKMIILGQGGKAIKKLGTLARKDIEKFTGRKVYLELSVKVNKDWRNNIRELKRFGYEH